MRVLVCHGVCGWDVDADVNDEVDLDGGGMGIGSRPGGVMSSSPSCSSSSLS